MRRFHHLVRAALGIVGCLAMNLAVHAHAAVMPGDHFTFNWTEAGGDELSGAVALTVGAPIPPPPPGLFSIASFVVTESGGFCGGVCTPESEDLSKAVFNATTLGLVGEITGTFTEEGELHSFVLTITDLVGGLPGTWTFEDLCDGCVPDISNGTYVVVASSAIPEPSTLLLFGSGVTGVVGMTAWRQHRRVRDGRAHAVTHRGASSFRR